MVKALASARQTIRLDVYSFTSPAVVIKRLREMYRSAGWPFLDTVDIELIAAGFLEQVTEEKGYATVRVTASGIAHRALSIQRNRQNRSAHEILVDRVGWEMLRDGRVVWTSLGLRAGLTAGVKEPVC